MRMLIVNAALALILLATPAGAHAYLDHAEPRVGSTVSTAPREISMSFSQRLEPAFSSAQVYDLSGARVDQGRAQIAGSVMRVSVKALPPGTYRVRWKVLSVDTHTTEGSFSFRVGP
jgi:methionine-rich copper-binding protein CopC